MSCIGASLSLVLLNRDRGGAPGRRACAVGQREYAQCTDHRHSFFFFPFNLTKLSISLRFLLTPTIPSPLADF